MSAVWFTVTLVMVAVVAAGVLGLLISQESARRHFIRAQPLPLPKTLPSISILKPVEGVGPKTWEALCSFCQVDYPGPLQILVGTLRPDDPVVPLVSRLCAAFPERKIRMVFAEPRGTNRKTSIMEALWREASGEYLFFSDADVRVEPDYLVRLVPELAAPGVGCLTCLPRGLCAESLGGKVVALHYAFSYLPQWMLALRTTGIDWAIGHTMAVPRTALERLGGFTGFLDHLADDYELGHRVAGLGFRVVLSPVMVGCYMPQENLSAAFGRLVRWKRTMRRARGVAFLGSALTYPVFWAGVLVLLHPAAGWAWSILGGVMAIRLLLALGLQLWVRLPDWKRLWLWLPLVDFLEGFTFLGAYTGNRIVWAGRRYRLLRDGKLKPETRQPAETTG
jgi:ceramide glucosyltransferase